MKLSKIALRNIRRNTKRSILSATAITVATMAIVFMFALINGMILDMQWNITSYITGEIRLHNREYDKNEMVNPVFLNIRNAEEKIEKINSLPDTTIAVPRIPFYAVVYKNDKSFNIKGGGLDFEKEREFQDLEKYIKKGSIPGKGSSGIVIGYKLAEKMGLGIGDKFTVLTTTVYRGSNAMTFEVAGIASFGIGGLNGSTFYASLPRVQKLLKSDNAVTEILVKVADKTNIEILKTAISGRMGK